jgi:hypothetical protein
MDTQGFIGLISTSGSLPLRTLGSFDIKPGHQNLVAISATIIDSDDSINSIPPQSRNCSFEWENSFLKIYKNYTQTNCIFECNFFYAQQFIKEKFQLSVGCVPWYFPSADDSPIICDPWLAVELTDVMSNVPDEKCRRCLPDCRTTIFKTTVTAVPLRKCTLVNLGENTFCNMTNHSLMNPSMLNDLVVWNLKNRFKSIPYYAKVNFTTSDRKFVPSLQKEDVFETTNNVYSAFDKDIAKVEIFFESATTVKILRSSRMTWIDFFSNIGGIYGLVLGMGIISFVELFWLFIRIIFVLETGNIVTEVKI